MTTRARRFLSPRCSLAVLAAALPLLLPAGGSRVEVLLHENGMASADARAASSSITGARRLPDGSTSVACSRLDPSSAEAQALSAVTEEPARTLEIRSSKMTLVVFDSPTSGFNDTRPALPAGGNPGTTIGQQRLNVVKSAADTWAATLDSSVEIRIAIAFIPSPCTVDFTILAFSQNPEAFLDFPGADFPGTWYPAALANRRAGRDLHSDDGTLRSNDITLGFNDLERPECGGAGNWYYGLDGTHGAGIDMLRIALHEIGHGLGFSMYANPATGDEFQGHPDVFERHVLDLSTGKHWHEMTSAERLVSATNAPNVVWDGGAATSVVSSILEKGVPVVESAGALDGSHEAGLAEFGPPVTAGGFSGPVASPAADGCSPLPDGSGLAGKVALADLARLPCLWVTQAFHLQQAGAAAVLLADYNDGGTPPLLTLVSDDPGVTIPSASISKKDGAALRAALVSSPVRVTVRLDLSRLAGESSGKVRLFAPSPLSGSAISHFDPGARPRLLMNPYQDDTPAESHSLDFTPLALRDLGWYSDSAPAQPRSPLRRNRPTRVEPPRK